MGRGVAGRCATRGAVTALAFVVLTLSGLSRGQAPAASEAAVPGVDFVLVLPLESSIYGRAADAVARGLRRRRVVDQSQDHRHRPRRRRRRRRVRQGAKRGCARRRRARSCATISSWSRRPPPKARTRRRWPSTSSTTAQRCRRLLHAGAGDRGGRQGRRARGARPRGADRGVVGADTPLQKRFAGAFTAEWILLGGASPAHVPLRSRTGHARATAHRARQDAAGRDRCSRSPRTTRRWSSPIVGHRRPAYTSSQVNDRQTQATVRDLDDRPLRRDPVAGGARRACVREAFRAATTRTRRSTGCTRWASMRSARAAAGRRSARPRHRVRRGHRPRRPRRGLAPVHPHPGADAVPRRAEGPRRAALTAAPMPMPPSGPRPSRTARARRSAPRGRRPRRGARGDLPRSPRHRDRRTQFPLPHRRDRPRRARRRHAGLRRGSAASPPRLRRRRGEHRCAQAGEAARCRRVLPVPLPPAAGLPVRRGAARRPRSVADRMAARRHQRLALTPALRPVRSRRPAAGRAGCLLQSPDFPVTRGAARGVALPR